MAVQIQLSAACSCFHSIYSFSPSSGIEGRLVGPGYEGIEPGKNSSDESLTVPGSSRMRYPKFSN